ncbi:MAG: ABC transporter ATP-binding protein [Anaerofustis stercorihominis]|nr:ABC transporter ATP-binding protein [Anaerofustis stercorihominis]
MGNIILKNIYKSFGEKEVLKDFSAEFPAGECSGIMGKSGCGKSTMLNIIMSVLPQDKGDVLNVPEKIAAVFQEDRLCEDFSAYTNIRLVCPKEKKEEIISAFERLGLGESIHKKVKELSGGMKRRVAIIRAVLSDWDLLIMDEPYKGLDEKTRKDVIDFVVGKTRGKTVIMVTHDEEDIKDMNGRKIDLW